MHLLLCIQCLVLSGNRSLVCFDLLVCPAAGMSHGKGKCTLPTELTCHGAGTDLGLSSFTAERKAPYQSAQGAVPAGSAPLCAEENESEIKLFT